MYVNAANLTIAVKCTINRQVTSRNTQHNLCHYGSKQVKTSLNHIKVSLEIQLDDDINIKPSRGVLITFSLIKIEFIFFCLSN